MNVKKYENELLYMPSKWCKRMEPTVVVNNHIDTIRLVSERVKKSNFCKRSDIKYGPGDLQLLDIYESNLLHCNTFVYIHGGYWQELNKDISAYCVEPLINAGIRVIVTGYDLAPNVTLNMIVDEIHQLLSYLVNNLEYNNIWLGGHSAGAHLAACMILPTIQEFSSEVKGFILISGIYDLAPLLKTTINNTLHLNELTCLELSPVCFLKKHLTNISWCGKCFLVSAENDSPAFKQQSTKFAQFLTFHGLEVIEECINGVDHFDIVENLANDDYILTRRIINLILNKS
ncbi:kynurenine formamidase [Adelges cooleyi]|uniref:kynurenine formamidase n=1 Tax=Adelges cooleyi TaxID=133065 RepID=UPI0021804AA3|nr:kynurenine formamidase [Adelges cooleyi]